MATEIYELIYKNQVNQAIADNLRYEASLLRIEAVVNRLLPLLAGLGRNTGMNVAANAANRAGAAFTALDPVLAALITRMNQLGTSAAGVAGGMGAAAGVAGRFGAGGGLGRAGLIGSAAAGIVAVGLRKVGEAAGDENRINRELAGMVTGLRGDRETQELANLMGKSSVDDDMLRTHFAFQRETGTNMEESLRFRTIFRGAVGPGERMGNISKKTTDEFEKAAAIAGLRTGMDMDTAGKLAGLMPLYGPIKSTDDGMRTFAKIQHNLNVEGVGTMAQLGRPFVGLMGTMGPDAEGKPGRVKDLVELSAIYGAATTRSRTPAGGATDVLQANALLLKLRGSAGITNEDDFMSSLTKVRPFLTGANPQDWIRNRLGTDGNRGEIEALIMMASKTLPFIRNAMKDPGLEIAGGGWAKANAEHMDSVSGRSKVAEATVLEANFGMGIRSERVEILRKAAEARLKKEGRIDTTATGWTDMASSVLSMGAASGREERIDVEVIENQIRRAEAIGRTDIADRLKGTLKRTSKFGGPGGGLIGGGRNIFNSEETGKRLDDIEASEKQLEAAEATIEAAKELKAAAKEMRGVPRSAVPPGVPTAVPGRP